jgi:hypothetical protein
MRRKWRGQIERRGEGDARGQGWGGGDGGGEGRRVDVGVGARECGKEESGGWGDEGKRMWMEEGGGGEGMWQRQSATTRPLCTSRAAW